MTEARVRGFSIATKCASVEELIEKFRDRVDDGAILVNTVESREIGTECSFAILLADKKVAIAGTCVVRDVYTDANNRFMRPGMLLAIKRLGPQSQQVFAQLVAKRIAPRRLTQALPIVSVPRASTQSIPPVIVMPRSAKPGVPETVQRRATQPMRGPRADSPALETAREAPRRMPTVQIPPRDELPEALLRAPRATPFELETIATQEAKQVVEAKGSAPRIEERTPGSPIVLPANPFTDLTDASLEGFVDCRLFEAKGALVEPNVAPLAMNGVVRKILDAVSEPMPLPPPPPPQAPLAREPQRPTPLPYAATKLPDLNIPHANDRVSQPLITRRLRNRLLMAVAIVPLLGAAVVVGYMKLAASPVPTAVAIAPVATATVEVHTSATASMEPAPPVPPQRIHAVLVKTYPIAARVTVAGRSFGTTPTYIKIPANTPLTVRIERPGFKPVTYPLTSKRWNDRVFVRLQRRGRR